ncbi:hypothetical protein CW713_07545 [Methanophagales archaeon]|nr:MAG: hypothetical protein CW714_01615 [Methanophagales archaeon]RJS80507.1 MAG: hypothetical protein CW713_07545 [Methanophagales archaeon]
MIKGIGVEGGSTNVTISNNNLISNWDQGIWMQNCGYVNVIDNEIISNRASGIILYAPCSNNIIIKNTLLNNSGGICLQDSSNNNIYLNNFINNTYNVASYNLANIWNSTEKITYAYKGKTYENYMGNYWDDYTGSDADGDGIGDTPYSIDSDKDNYPLMEPWENYFAPTRNIFDTGQPENPYPSIFGTHTGKIKPNHSVIVNTIYTYSCSGTGGHTEYVRFENESWNVTAKWDGYKEDWHNITFDEPFTLYAGLTYNYTIITGSYPQIHHNKTLTVPDGEITCLEFIDANRKRYDDWIPAIRLE